MKTCAHTVFLYMLLSMWEWTTTSLIWRQLHALWIEPHPFTIAMGCDDVTFILIMNTLRRQISKSVPSSSIPYLPMYKPWAYLRTQYFSWAYTQRGGLYTRGSVHECKKWYLSEKHVSTQWVISTQNHRLLAFFCVFFSWKTTVKQLKIT